MNPTLAAMPRPYNWFNQLTGVTAPDGGAPTTFAYDANGNQVSKTDRLGTTTYAYNLDNRLVGISAPGGVTSTYGYDANGLRTKKSDSTGTRSYQLDGLSIVAEYAPDASRLAWYTQSLARIDEVLNVVNGQGKYWYETDALGSTYAMTSAAGAVVSRSSYDVFGERALVSANDVIQPFGFTGREHDQGGLVYARARYLSPSTGRWISADPIGQLAGPNYYGFVRGMPSRATDATGLADSMSAYAMAYPVPFLFLMKDLGIIKAVAMVVSAGAVAYPISQVISNADDDAAPTTITTSTSDTCTRRQPRQERTYYRGLSVDDVREMTLFGQVLSKFARYGLGGFVEALEYFVAGARNHPASSDVVDWDKMVPSPFVSTSANLATARAFAEEGPSPGHAVVSFTTTRAGIGPTPGFGEGEYLFFYLLGEPGERLEWVP